MCGQGCGLPPASQICGRPWNTDSTRLAAAAAHAGGGAAAARCGHVPHAPAKIAMPCGDVFVRQARRDIKHDDRTLAMDVVPIAQATKLFLPCRVPAVEADLATVGREVQRTHLNANGGCMGWDSEAGGRRWQVMRSPAAAAAACAPTPPAATPSAGRSARVNAHVHTSSQTLR
jgi:hypothetical protein